MAVQGTVVAAGRRSSSGSVSLEIDDGSGPLRVSLGATLGIDPGPLVAGAWVEVRGVLGQDTTGAQPLRGYRVWPREAADLRVVAAPAIDSPGASGTAGGAGAAMGADAAPIGLEAVGAGATDGLRVRATLVSGAWPELELGGLLWDGDRLVGLEASAATAVGGVLGSRRPPIAVELTGPRAAPTRPGLGLPMIRLGDEPTAIVVGSAPPSAPATALPTANQPPRWVALVGRLAGSARDLRLVTGAGSVAIELACHRHVAMPAGTVGITGIAVAAPPRLIAGCGGIIAAPSLHRPAEPAGPVARPRTPTLAGRSPRDGGAASVPVGPAALLGMAAAALLGGAVLARRRALDEPDPDEPVGSGSGDAVDVPTTPALTLVTLPRERAP